MSPRSIFVLVLILQFSWAPVAFAQAARMAEAAYKEIKDNCFDGGRISHAQKEIALAESQQPNDAWVHIAKAALILNEGYTKGSWLRASTFEPGTVDNCQRELLIAVKLSPNIPEARHDLAEIYAIKENYRQAWAELDVMNKLRPNDFSHWALRGEIYTKMGDYPNAEKMLDVAMRLANNTGRKSFVNQCLLDVAKKKKDLKLAEALYRKSIEIEPNSPHKWGNFGRFLLCNGRAADAVPYLKKAVALGTYPLAEQDLAEALQKTGQK